jgi:hypothetical protein
LSFPLTPGTKRSAQGQLASGRSENEPVIGILASDAGSRFRGNSRNFQDIIAMGQQMGALVYVFTPSRLKEDHVQGYLYSSSSKKWSRQKLPLPHVVYNRIPYREHEQHPRVKSLLHRLENLNIPYYNPCFFRKNQLFEWLKGASELQNYLPDTRVLRHYDDFHSMLKEHGTVYLKPADGMAGSGIMRIEQKQQGYILRTQDESGNESIPFEDIEVLWKKVEPTVRSTRYLIQKGIVLSTIQNRPFDLRALIQKDQRGEWRVTGIGARIAGPNSITTHVPRGGSIGHPLDALRHEHGRRAPQILKDVKAMALQLAAAIEKHGVAPLGEMSMDIALDRDGNPWFLEANSKPMKFDEPRIRRKSLQRIIEYCSYLSGQSLNIRGERHGN